MYTYHNKVLSICNKKLRYYSDYQISDAEDDLQNWKNNPNKHEVDHFYQDPLFGIIYVRSLYMCRIQSFREVLDRLSKKPEVKFFMTNIDNVVSLGCGPGPEIAAYVDFVRDECSNNLHLNIEAFDVVGHWKDFVKGCENCDGNVTVNFNNVLVNSSFLARTHLSGVCLMSYPEAVKFDRDFWNRLKGKFDLVILIDQSKRILLQNLAYCGYSIETMEFKGSKKYAYHVNSHRVNSMASQRRLNSITNSDIYKIQLENPTPKSKPINSSSLTSKENYPTIYVPKIESIVPKIKTTYIQPMNSSSFSTNRLSSVVSVPRVESSYDSKPKMTNLPSRSLSSTAYVPRDTHPRGYTIKDVDPPLRSHTSSTKKPVKIPIETRYSYDSIKKDSSCSCCTIL